CEDVGTDAYEGQKKVLELLEPEMELFSKPAHYDLDLNTQKIPIVTLNVLEEAAADYSKLSHKALIESRGCLLVRGCCPVALEAPADNFISNIWKTLENAFRTVPSRG
ncbi:hypothetical protein STEG23_015220, partial [Scotinomys teguina]